jgi:hypothetical protein
MKLLLLEDTFCGAENWTLRKVDQKYQENFECISEKGWRKSIGPIV